jgi:hypothetical protein
VSGIGFGQFYAEAAEIVVERLKLAQRVCMPRPTHLFADYFAESHEVKRRDASG